MDDPNDWGAAEPIRQSVKDLVHAIGHHLGMIPDPPASAHDKAIQQMNDAANAQRTADATKSFIKPDVAAKIRAKAK